MRLLDNILTAPLGHTHIFFIGQAGFILKSSNGQIIGIDLYLSECVERIEGHIGFKRLIPCLLNSSEITLDALIATHPHCDHFDIDAIPELMNNDKTILYASVNCEKLIHSQKINKNRVCYVKPGDTYQNGDFRFSFVNCDHGLKVPDAVGVIVCVDGKIIYETGDTCLRLDRLDEYRKFGKIDVMIAPINGAYGNMNEMDCTQLSKALDPELTIPCHYGMFASHGGNPAVFMQQMKKQCSDKKFLFMCPGERLTLS